MADFTAADGSLQIKATERANVPEETVLGETCELPFTSGPLTE
jgi:hypothetical protein